MPILAWTCPDFTREWVLPYFTPDGSRSCPSRSSIFYPKHVVIQPWEGFNSKPGMSLLNHAQIAPGTCPNRVISWCYEVNGHLHPLRFLSRSCLYPRLVAFFTLDMSLLNHGQVEILPSHIPIQIWTGRDSTRGIFWFYPVHLQIIAHGQVYQFHQEHVLILPGACPDSIPCMSIINHA